MSNRDCLHVQLWPEANSTRSHCLLLMKSVHWPVAILLRYIFHSILQTVSLILPHRLVLGLHVNTQQLPSPTSNNKWCVLTCGSYYICSSEWYYLPGREPFLTCHYSGFWKPAHVKLWQVFQRLHKRQNVHTIWTASPGFPEDNHNTYCYSSMLRHHWLEME